MKKAKAAHEKAAAAVAKAEAEVDQLERALADARKTRDRLQTDATLAKNEYAHAARKVRD
jgi:chromosome segregation ATPase